MNEIPYQSIGKIYNTTHLHELLFMLRSMIGALQNNDVRLKNNSNLHTQMECFCNCTKVGSEEKGFAKIRRVRIEFQISWNEASP